jgi:hypothetical protein
MAISAIVAVEPIASALVRLGVARVPYALLC